MKQPAADRDKVSALCLPQLGFIQKLQDLRVLETKILVCCCQQAAMSEGRLVLVPGDLRESGTQLIWPLQRPSVRDGEVMSFAVNSAVSFATIRSGFLQLYGGQPGCCSNFAFAFPISYAEKQRELARKGSLKNGNMGSPVNQQPKKNNVMARTR